MIIDVEVKIENFEFWIYLKFIVGLTYFIMTKFDIFAAVIFSINNCFIQANCFYPENILQYERKNNTIFYPIRFIKISAREFCLTLFEPRTDDNGIRISCNFHFFKVFLWDLWITYASVLLDNCKCLWFQTKATIVLLILSFFFNTQVVISI